MSDGNLQPYDPKREDAENSQYTGAQQPNSSNTPQKNTPPFFRWSLSTAVIAVAFFLLLILSLGAFFYMNGYFRNDLSNISVQNDELPLKSQTPASTTKVWDAAAIQDDVSWYNAVVLQKVEFCNGIADIWKKTGCLLQFNGFKFKEEPVDLTDKIFQRQGNSEGTSISTSLSQNPKGSWFAALIKPKLGLAKISFDADFVNAEKGEALLTVYINDKKVQTVDGRVLLNENSEKVDVYVPSFDSDDSQKILGFRLDAFGQGEVRVTVKNIIFSYYTNSPYHIEADFPFHVSQESVSPIENLDGYSHYSDDGTGYSFLYPSGWKVFPTKGRGLFSLNGVNIMPAKVAEANKAAGYENLNTLDFGASQPIYNILMEDPIISVSGTMFEDPIPDSRHFDFPRFRMYSYINGLFETLKGGGIVEVTQKKDLIIEGSSALFVEYNVLPSHKKGMFLLKLISAQNPSGSGKVPIGVFALQYRDNSDGYSKEIANTLISSFKDGQLGNLLTEDNL